MKNISEIINFTDADIFIVDIYKEVLSGKRKRFPNFTWTKPDARQNAIECTKFLIENILNWNDDDIRHNLNKFTFGKNKLWGMIGSVYNNSAYDAINDAYPDKFKPWELPISPKNTWNIDNKNAEQSLNWIVHKENLTFEKILSTEYDEIKNIFRRNGLGGMLKHTFNNSIFKAMSLYDSNFNDYLKEYIESNKNKYIQPIKGSYNFTQGDLVLVKRNLEIGIVVKRHGSRLKTENPRIQYVIKLNDGNTKTYLEKELMPLK